MAKIFDFPPLVRRMHEQSDAAINRAMKIIINDALRHLHQACPELIGEHGEAIMRVWIAFILGVMTNGAYDEAIKIVGSEQKYQELLKALMEKM